MPLSIPPRSTSFRQMEPLNYLYPTSYLHTGHGLTYDKENVSPHYVDPLTGSTGDLHPSLPIKLYLNDLLNRSFELVNCMDTTAGVQTLGGVLGIKSNWQLMVPFGYIKTNNVIGLGMTNNPVFIQDPDNNPVWLKDMPSRSKYRGDLTNHNYIIFDGFVFDACVGPVCGEKPEKNYLLDAIDPIPTLVIDPNNANSQVEPGVMEVK